MPPTVVIDPGHGGTARVGGSSPNNVTGPNGLLEKDLTLELGQRVATGLGTRASVVLTRQTDVNRSLADRAQVARDAQADVFLSIHLNGYSDPSVDGSEAWVATHSGASSHALAQSVLDRVVAVVGAPNRGVKAQDFGVLLPDRVGPATAASLVELAFLTNPSEAQRLTGDGYRQSLAQAIAEGIAQQLGVGAAAPAPTAQSLSGGPPPPPSTIFLAPNSSSNYTDYIQPVTRGDLEPLINGRSSNPAVDRSEPLDRMQEAVQNTTSGDSVYLAAWFFNPRTPLTLGPYNGMSTWGGLFFKKASEGVNIRILNTDFDPISGSLRTNVRGWMAIMDAFIARLDTFHQDNLQYVVSLHPATYGALRAIWVGHTSVHIGSHHQKFMVVKQRYETTAFCGGVDIETGRTPAGWSYSGLVGWHDIHLKLRGPIARDLEKEFAMRWNRESGSSTVVPSPNPWGTMATLPIPSPPLDQEADAAPDRQLQDVQMERTVSSDATLSAFTTNQDNVKQTYRNIVQSSEVFLYFENQYFRSLDLADWIVAAGQAHPSMPVIFVVVDVPDDGDDDITQEGVHLQNQFFDRVHTALGSHAGIYTMTNRAVHSKFLLADDRYMTIGSANANERSFQLDSELNVAIDNAALSTAFRTRLWAHNLGVTEATVTGWAVSDYIAQWEAAATANAGLALTAMAGEGVVRWDYTTHPGNSHIYIPDYLADASPEKTDAGAIAGDPSSTPPSDDETNTAMA